MTLEQKEVIENVSNGDRKEKKGQDPNDLIVKWVNIVRFKDKVTSLLFKTTKNKDFINAKILIRTNDYKIKDGYVTVNAQLTVQGLKDLNMAAYNSLKIIMEHMEKKGIDVKKTNKL